MTTIKQFIWTKEINIISILLSGSITIKLYNIAFVSEYNLNLNFLDQLQKISIIS